MSGMTERPSADSEGNGAEKKPSRLYRSRLRYRPRITPTVAETPPGNLLADPGSADVGCFFGWVPAAIAAVISGIVIGIATRSPQAFVVGAIAGTIVGYAVCLLALFAVADSAWANALKPRAAELLFAGLVLAGVPAAVVAAAVVGGMFSR